MSLLKLQADAQTAFLGLGSNLGERCLALAQAVERLDRDPGIQVVAGSSLYATDPVGLPNEPEFVNAAVEIRTVYDPEALLDVCLAIEAGLGRVRGPRPSSRTIDIDILIYGELSLDGPRLRVPHPRIKDRAFVLVPLAEIAPDVVIGGRSIASWAAAAGWEGVRRLDAPRL